MVLWKLKESQSYPKDEQETLRELVYLMIKNFKIKKKTEEPKKQHQREQDRKFLRRGRGDMLRWKGEQIKLKSCELSNTKKPFASKRRKGAFLEMVNPFQTNKYIRSIQMINKSLDIKTRYPRKVAP